MKYFLISMACISMLFNFFWHSINYKNEQIINHQKYIIQEYYDLVINSLEQSCRYNLKPIN